MKTIEGTVVEIIHGFAGRTYACIQNDRKCQLLENIGSQFKLEVGKRYAIDYMGEYTTPRIMAVRAADQVYI